ncbi:radical SAM family heme chaperone HemW [Sulfurimonas autotrophica]|uniref:Heme chaperone HemW n=1 Tax=Sulfurimonas autotrophica (strain ATCC BAA-671 / DSM 16294 / JCM 11897 / OK10) TaxID=563040 RepID=E0UPT9_SULAO|nr:radical SAM family heme chaperone HemW [Sulfurimonas autotrophica]ADN09748.1 oxygen-independent coproporphyrinogen III oxidase [Sulfurimonas autotrophica DSM 16294]
MLVYIHIPFCDSKCSYCAFNSYVDKFHLKEKYMQALKKQLQHELLRFQAKKETIETVFIGGGTPSTVNPKLYEDIFALLNPYLVHNAEITSEANPNSATKEWLEGMKKLGVNRISFGTQTFDKEKLKLLNRAHTPQISIDAVHNASQIGFKNISLDLIYATLGDTKELLASDLHVAMSLPINHISAYALMIEEGTAFENRPQMSSEQLSLTKWLFQKIQKYGFKQYEISNFGTYQSLHNLGYWKYKDYIGAGAGAVGKLGLMRFYPQTDIETYIDNPLKIQEEMLSQEDKRLEQIFLGLRSVVGINQDILNTQELKKAEILLDEQKLKLENNILYNEDYLLADEIALFLTS